MQTVRNRLAALTSMLGLFGASSAQAGDWTGISFGVGGGYGLVNHEIDVSEGPLVPVPIQFNVNLDGLGGEGGFFSIGAGADYQLNSRLVIGAFVDYDFMSLESSASLAIPLAGASARADVEVEDQLSVGGRLGFLATPSTLVFVSAGYSRVDVSNVDFTASLFGSTTRGVLASVGNLDGYFLGGGIETRLVHGFTLKAEYRYTDLDAEGVTLLPDLAPAVNDFARAEIAPSIQTARLSLNYRFGLGHRGEGDASLDHAAAGPTVWSGPYIGVGAGYGAANNNITLREGPLLPPGLFTVDLDGTGHRGELFSIGAGYDFEVHSRFVIGAFIDYDLANIEHSDSISLAAGPFGANASLSAEFENLLMVGARIGYLATPDTMLFASAGYARADLSETEFDAEATFLGSASGVLVGDQEFSGFFAGAGIETALSNGLTLKTEYRYIDLGSERMQLLPGLAPAINDFVTTEFEPTIQTGRISINYKFGGPGESAQPMK